MTTPEWNVPGSTLSLRHWATLRGFGRSVWSALADTKCKRAMTEPSQARLLRSRHYGSPASGPEPGLRPRAPSPVSGFEPGLRSPAPSPVSGFEPGLRPRTRSPVSGTEPGLRPGARSRARARSPASGPEPGLPPKGAQTHSAHNAHRSSSQCSLEKTTVLTVLTLNNNIL